MTVSTARGSPASTAGHADVQWVQVGIVAGMAASVIYPVIIFAPLPLRAAAALSAFLGPAIGMGSLGIYRLLQAHGSPVTAGLGLVHNLLAGCVLTVMLLVQLAVRMHTPDAARGTSGVWLGLDVAWDVYIALGTIFFAYAMRRHPRFGLAFTFTGAAIGLLLLVLNLAVFPVPPGKAGLLDAGPLVGLWYLAVTAQMWRSLRWLRSTRAAPVPVGT